MLIVSYWMDHRAPNGGSRESTQGTKGICNPIGIQLLAIINKAAMNIVEHVSFLLVGISSAERLIRQMNTDSDSSLKYHSED